MSFSEDYIQAFDVSDYLEATSKVRHSNKTNLMVSPCPMCGDTRPHKFYIKHDPDSERNGTWNSYCCHQQGSIVDLVMALEGMDRHAAVSFIRAHVDGTDEMKMIPLVESMRVIEEAPLQMPTGLMPARSDLPIVFKGQPITLNDRGVTDYIIARHNLKATAGFGTHYNGKMRVDLNNRLVLPIIDAEDPMKMVSWQARDLSGTQTTKYLFPTDDKSSTTLYGWHEAKTCPTILIVEGAFAKWRFDRLGRERGNGLIENFSVASFGKKLSQTQEDLIINSPDIKRVILAWDLDAAEQVRKVAARLAGRKELLIMMPSTDGKDFDEMADAQLLGLMAEAEPFSYSLAARMAARMIA